MARKKVKMAYIVNDPTRKATGKKRAMGAMKKAGELSVLCGIDACLIIVLEDGSVLAWPSLPEAMGVIDRYKSMPEVEQCKKKMDGEDYVRDRIGKVQEQLRKAERENRQRETMLLLHDAMAGRHGDLAGLTVEQLVGIGWTTETLIRKIKDGIAYAAATAANEEAPHPQQSWVMEVVKAGWDLEALPHNGGSSSGSGSSAGAGHAWADPGTYFPTV